ncbi:MAG TPA: NADH-quinone oxidoreductase subunit L, partial [Burkholderiales bacterium]|nr:NADH-quinone oxidoreductase subunit L [Burkholderiales bacterium]
MKAIYLIIPFAPLLGAIVAGLFGRRIGRVGAHSVTIFAVLLSFLCSCVVFYDVLQGNTFNGPVYTWLTMGDTRLEIGFLIDRLTTL